MIGEKALRAEIEQLKQRGAGDLFIPELHPLKKKLFLLQNNRKMESLLSRENDDAYIGSLRKKEAELFRLSTYKIDLDQIQAVRVDQEAFPPQQRIKPKRKLIVMLGIVLGLMLGVFLAFFMSFLEDQRNKEEK